MEIFNPWLVFSLILLGIWAAIWLARPALRPRMLQASFLTSIFGITEPLFVPAYWNPPSLFDLARATGFDLESFVFSFAIGGIGLVIYEIVFPVRHAKMGRQGMHARHHRYHTLVLLSPILVFLPLLAFTHLNPIYTASLAMLAGGLAAVWCRPDLWRKIFLGGALFLLLYFAFFLSFDVIYPGLVQKVWNLPALSGLLVLGVPLEELVFAFTFGLLWSSYYEHLGWYRIEPTGKKGAMKRT